MEQSVLTIFQIFWKVVRDIVMYLDNRANLADFLDEYLILGPEEHLLRSIFGTQVRLISPELEHERNSAVAAAVDALPVFKKELLRVHFGLEDGLPKSLEAAGRQLGLISKKRPSRLELYKLTSTEQEAFRGLRRNLTAVL